MKAAAVVLSGFVALWLLRDAPPAWRLGAASLGMIWLIKVAALTLSERLRGPGLLAFFLWPGVSPEGFRERAAEPVPSAGSRFREAWLCFLAGVALLLAASLGWRGASTPANYAALVAVFLIVHLGLVEVVADALRLAGFSPRSLFDRPWRATSLRDFWSLRWNRAFVDMNRIFLQRPLQGRVSPRLLAFAIFLVSGLLHELGISYADGVSWGKPLAYFAIQGTGIELERRRAFPRALAWLWILLPLPLLFPPAFVNLFVGGLARAIADGLRALPFLPAAFTLGGCLHLLVLCASVQVPARLSWREEFARLRPLNRKVFYTYGAYIFSIIVFMAAVSFRLAFEAATPAGELWAAFIALFWTARVLTDIFYMSDADWPPGPLFRVGHVCLTTVFASLALLYSAIALGGLFA